MEHIIEKEGGGDDEQEEEEGEEDEVNIRTSHTAGHQFPSVILIDALQSSSK